MGTSQNESEARDGFFLPWFFWCFALLALLSFVGANSLWTVEARFAEAVREMLLSGDWLHPTFNGEALSPRPLLAHWAMGASALLTGCLDEVSLRLPGVFAGLLTLFAVRRLGTHLFGNAAGATASWLLLGSCGFLFWGRIGTADMANTSAVALCLMWFFETRERPGFWSSLIFFLLFFAGTQFKGTVAMLALPALLAPALCAPGAWRKLFGWRTFLAFLLALAVFLVPRLLLAGDAQRLAAAGAAQFGGGNFPAMPNDFLLYFRALPGWLAPWSLLVLLPVAGLFGRRGSTPRECSELLRGSALAFVVLTLFPWRQDYYVLVLLPPLCVCAACALCTGVGRPSWTAFAIAFSRYAAATAASIAVVSLIALPFWKQILGFTPPPVLLAGLPILGALALVVLTADEFGRRASILRLTAMKKEFAGVILASDILACGTFAVLLPQYHLARTERTFLAEMHRLLADVPQENVIYWGGPSLRLLFYLDRPPALRTARTAEQLSAALKGHPRRMVLLTDTAPESIASLKKALNDCGIELDLERPAYHEKYRAIDNENTVKYAVFFIDERNRKKR